MSLTRTAECRALLARHLIPGLGPRLTAALLQRFGSAEAVLRASAGQLREVPYMGTKLAADLAEAVGRVDVDADLDQMNRHGVRRLVLATPDYPASLAPSP